jgi:hypothetical protein
MYTRFSNCPIDKRKQANKEWQRYSEHSRKMEDQDLDMLFGILRKHIRDFWD